MRGNEGEYLRLTLLLVECRLRSEDRSEAGDRRAMAQDGAQ